MLGGCSCAELIEWRAYEVLYGLPLVRLEAATAIAGAAICQTWGGKVKPSDLLPKIDNEADNAATLPERMAAWAIGHNAAHDARMNTSPTT